MIVLVRVNMALSAAGGAGACARLHECAQKFRVSALDSSEQSPGDTADVGTVQIEPNAQAQGLHVRVRQAGVGAFQTGSLALRASRQALRARSCVHTGRSGAGHRRAVVESSFHEMSSLTAVE